MPKKNPPSPATPTLGHFSQQALAQSLWDNTRTFVGPRHALLTPDGHIPSALPGWRGIVPFALVTPALGADLSQYLIKSPEPGIGYFAANERQRFIYLHSEDDAPKNTEVKLKINEIDNFDNDEIELVQKKEITLKKNGDYCFIPALHEIHLEIPHPGAELTVFESRHEFLTETDIVAWNHATPDIAKKYLGDLSETEDLDILPPIQHGNFAEIPAIPFMGYERAMLTVILPADDLRYDMAVNHFRYGTGATLPLVETHIMEHGLIMVEGQGVYRLEDKYYPVKQGDAIWMAPHCPQWYISMGDTPSAYLYFKNHNRTP